MRRSSKLAAGVAILVLAALGAAIAVRPTAARGDAPTPTAVTVTGHGVVTTVPDRATIAAGVHTEAATAATALAANSTAASAVIAALRQAGAEQVQTQQVSLWPKTDRSGNVVGYTADDTVSAEAPVGVAGRLIDAAVAAGANTVSGPELAVSDQQARYREALALAFADARAKAEALAKAGGFALGPVSSVTESSAAPQPLPARAAAEPAGTPVEPGTQDVAADVTVAFGIR